MARFGAAALAVAVLAAFTATAGGAESRVSGYDGSIPFECVLQQLGRGTDFPRPGDDPFCVEYDKRQQNVTQLGVVEFLAQEPARVAAAGPKCWYFQRDHWVGSIVQDDGTTQTYKWDGSYFYDKARGLGGVYIENFTVNNQTGDPRELPGFPEEWRPYFGPGRGGVQSSDTVRADPRCVARAKGAPAPGPYKCSEQGGKVGKGIGPLALGTTRSEAEAKLGPPARQTDGVLRWCTAGGGKLSAAFKAERLRFALTTSERFSAFGFAPGERSGKARQRYRKLTQRGGVAVLLASAKGRRLLIGADRKRIRFIAIAPSGANAKAIDAWLDATR